jgi:lipocalin-like protein
MDGAYVNDEFLSRKHLLGFAASFGILGALGPQPAAAASSLPVIGAWKLESFNVDEGKNAEKPRWGPNPAGYLMYTENERMAAVLMGTRRASLKPPQSAGAPASGACVESVADFLAYAGRYEVKGDRVFHHVEVCVFTNLVGTTLERRFAITGDTLTIRTVPPEIWGSSNVLVWKRA